MFYLAREVDRNGRLVVPAPLRKRYSIDIGQIVQFVPTEEGLLLKPCPEDAEASGKMGYIVTDGRKNQTAKPI